MTTLAVTLFTTGLGYGLRGCSTAMDCPDVGVYCYPGKRPGWPNHCHRGNGVGSLCDDDGDCLDSGNDRRFWCVENKCTHGMQRREAEDVPAEDVEIELEDLELDAPELEADDLEQDAPELQAGESVELRRQERERGDRRERGWWHPGCRWNWECGYNKFCLHGACIENGLMGGRRLAEDDSDLAPPLVGEAAGPEVALRRANGKMCLEDSHCPAGEYCQTGATPFGYGVCMDQRRLDLPEEAELQAPELA